MENVSNQGRNDLFFQKWSRQKIQEGFMDFKTNYGDRLPKVLIAEDNQQTMELMKKYFLKAKERGDIRCELLEAYNGDDAIKIIKEEYPDIILCDIGMPGKDGFEVLDHFNMVRDNQPYSVFVFCSASPEEKIKAFNSGATGFISKKDINYFVMTLQIQAWLRLSFLERKKQKQV